MNLIEENRMFDKMKKGIPVIGCQIRGKSLAMAEMAAYAGLDYVFIEGEHFPYNIESYENMIRAIQLGGSTPIVRIPSHEDGLILSCLEAGVMGIIFPHIETREDALHAMGEVKFAPVGHRGYGDSARASKYGFVPDEKYLEMVNRNVMCIGMIESQTGIKNLDSILDTGIDVLRVGARDLSLDMGYGGKVTPEVRAVVVDVCKRINASDKVILGDAGLGGMGCQEDFDFVKGLGCKMFTLGSEMAIFKKSIVASLGKFNEMNNK